MTAGTDAGDSAETAGKHAAGITGKRVSEITGEQAGTKSVTEQSTSVGCDKIPVAGTNLMVYLSGMWGLCTTGGGLEKEKRNS